MTTEHASANRAYSESGSWAIPDALIFDLDGLIVDTERVVFEVWTTVFEEHGCSFSEIEWSHAVGGSDSFRPLEVLQERSQVPVGHLAALINSVETRIEARLEGINALPGVASWMNNANLLGVRIGVASNSPRAWVEARLTQVGLRHLVDAMSCRDESPNSKPAPDIYLTACSRLDVPPHLAVAVEDSMTGIAAAKAAGIQCIAVPTAFTRHHDLSAADVIVESLASAEFVDTMKRLSSKC